MIMPSLTIFGFFLTTSGFAFKLKNFEQKELQLVEKLQAKLTNYPRTISFFKEMWVFGTTAVMILSLLLMVIDHFTAGLIVTCSYLLFAIAEKALKKSFQRSRPFQRSDTIEILQPKIPKDPSFPSGDALRIWFLAITFPYLFSFPIYTYGVTSIIALFVTIGRVALGAHYPTDTLSGSGMGILGATTAIYIIEHLSIL